MNVKCSDTKVYSTNFYHFLAQQMQAVYFYSVMNSLQKVNLFYEGPFESILQCMPFVNVCSLAEAPPDTETIEPIKDYKQIKAYAEYLKCHILSKINIKQTNDIVIIQRTKNRTISNIDEISELLKRNNTIKIAKLEELSFLEQTELLYNAKTVIMPHGAAMAFCMLLSNKTKIIELYPKYFNVLSYYTPIAEKFGIPHVELECESVPGSGHLDQNGNLRQEDIDLLKMKMNSLNRFNTKDIHADHRLRSLLRDVKNIHVDYKTLALNI